MCFHLGSKIELGKMASMVYGAQFPMSLDMTVRSLVPVNLPLHNYRLHFKY